MIEQKKKMCSGPCNSLQYIWKNYKGQKFCKQCWLTLKPNMDSVNLVNKSFIKPKSDKKAPMDALYSVLRKKFLTQYPTCKARLPKCTSIATDVHHKKGRGEFYLKVETWLPVCRMCHDWIELHPEDAKNLGFSESRLDIN